MRKPLRIEGLLCDPWAYRDKQAPSPYMAKLVDGRWLPLTKRRYYCADRGMTRRGL